MNTTDKLWVNPATVSLAKAAEKLAAKEGITYQQALLKVLKALR